ncbi:MAG: hypothetical protein RR626_05330 [Anaerovoracaceae bacterium]
MKKKEKTARISKQKGTVPPKKKITIAIYVLIRILVVTVLVISVLHHNWSNVFTCGLALLLFMVPSFIERKMHIDLPDTLEVIILLFIFAAEIMGEIQGFYVIFDRWDDILHTLNGFLAAAIGFSLIDILNREEKVGLNLSPAFVAMVAFCFSMTIGVLWEFFECAMDMYIGTDMQKDTWINGITSVSIGEAGSNEVINLMVDNVTLNGTTTWNQYLDIGLYDTMHDLFVNFLGALVFSVFGLVYIKNRGKGFVSRFIPVSRKKEEE